MRVHRHDEMPVDVEGWLSSPRVQRMTCNERGIFFGLLCRAWADRDCSLPEDPVDLQFLAGATDAEWEDGNMKVLAMFEKSGGRLINPKQREVLAEQNRRLESARKGREAVARYRANHQNGSTEEITTEPDPTAPKEPFPPTLDSVKLEMAKQGLPESKASEFIAFYGSKGWVVGKSKMKDWRQAVTTWRIKWEKDGRPGLTPGSPKRPMTKEEREEENRRLVREAQY